MATFCCLLMLDVLLLGAAVRPGLEPMRGAAEDANLLEEDPCERHNAETLWLFRCRCKGDFLTDASCRTPGVKEFDSEDEKKECNCGDPECGQFAAKKDGDMCTCGRYDVANQACSRPAHHLFPIEGNSEDCRCQSNSDWVHSVANPVKSSALAFCEAAVKSSRKPRPDVSDCQRLVAGLPSSSKGFSDKFKTVERLSDHPDAHGFGRLDALVDKQAAMWHLEQVCRDECEDLVKSTEWQNVHIFDGSFNPTEDQTPKPPFLGCAERVVRQVEADLLGCCGRSCGWNGQSCISWPFMEETDKVDWLEECCTEYNVLKGSKRETMCGSVLDEHDASIAAANDSSQERNDVGGAFVGQDSQLVWTEEGVNSEFGKKYAYMNPMKGQPVPEMLLALNPNIRSEALEKKWFEEKEIEPASLLQLEGGDCGDEREMETCHKDFKQSRIRTCGKEKGWMYTSGTSKQLKGQESKLIRQLTEYQGASKSPKDCTDPKSYGRELSEVKHFLFEYTRFTVESKGNKWSITCFAEMEGKELVLTEGPEPLQTVNKMRRIAFDKILYWVEASKVQQG